MAHKIAFSFTDGKTLFCSAQGNESVLDAALRNGIKIPLDCREGVCGTCQGRCDSGSYTQEYVDEDTLSADDLAQRKVLTCQTRVQSDAAFSFDFDSSLCSAPGTQTLTGTVCKIEQVSAGTAILHVDASAQGAALDYLPGQYARVQVPGTGHWRSYSFAAAPGSSTLQFLVRLLPDGVMSNYLRERCQVGDPIELEAPLGAFYLRHVGRPLLMIAGGTGLSAFLGMLDTLAASGGTGYPVTLFYGVRKAADICEVARLEAFKASIPGFTYEVVVSDAEPEWTGKTGYVDASLEHQKLRDFAHDIYICGPPPMVESIKAWHTRHELAGSPVYLEKFTESNT
ncbi:anthranilate 1,2-dioxygenase electron transfer component AntC [Pseudomonas entomophila]|uniref:anthranilate 1,2-dioxygenase electron transfer component AntC n=1 Tax=Pseudomonas entomophila TaxID=312306 RepID=UPI0023D8BFF1|nr:anthranilate 1,2-dioxygenase electron transfer component AntC [Pseudomonas entomophila]MDF0730129.1 anthranilate 1,2-dioxygenase electron transfer component AntC [Pseudomonas entomophila]